MPYAENLVVHLNVGDYIMKRVLIDLVADISILYNSAFKEMGFPLFMLNTPLSSTKSFKNNIASTIGIICLPVS